MLWWLFITLDFNIPIRLHILSDLEGIESVTALPSAQEIILDYIRLIKFVTIDMVFFHVAVIFVFLELL